MLFDCDAKQKVAFNVKEAILEYITKRKKYQHEQMEKTQIYEKTRVRKKMAVDRNKLEFDHEASLYFPLKIILSPYFPKNNPRTLN